MPTLNNGQTIYILRYRILFHFSCYDKSSGVDDDNDEAAEVQTNVVLSQNYAVVYAIYVYCSINFEWYEMIRMNVE